MWAQYLVNIDTIQEMQAYQRIEPAIKHIKQSHIWKLLHECIFNIDKGCVRACVRACVRDFGLPNTASFALGGRGNPYRGRAIEMFSR